jgi:hypothetical protein
MKTDPAQRKARAERRLTGFGVSAALPSGRPT